MIDKKIVDEIEGCHTVGDKKAWEDACARLGEIDTIKARERVFYDHFNHLVKHMRETRTGFVLLYSERHSPQVWSASSNEDRNRSAYAILRQRMMEDLIDPSDKDYKKVHEILVRNDLDAAWNMLLKRSTNEYESVSIIQVRNYETMSQEVFVKCPGCYEEIAATVCKGGVNDAFFQCKCPACGAAGPLTDTAEAAILAWKRMESKE